MGAAQAVRATRSLPVGTTTSTFVRALRQAAIQRINAIHNRYAPSIKRDDMAYTLWVFCFEPMRWIERCVFPHRRVSG